MTHPRNDEIQYSLVSYLKAQTKITAEVSSDEIREVQWQGAEFDYPNVRVRLIANNPVYEQEDCTMSSFRVGFQVHSQQDSSQQANKIAGIISEVLHAKSFVSQSIQIYMKTTNLVPAIRSDARTWRAEVLMIGTASG